MHVCMQVLPQAQKLHVYGSGTFGAFENTGGPHSEGPHASLTDTPLSPSAGATSTSTEHLEIRSLNQTAGWISFAQ